MEGLALYLWVYLSLLVLVLSSEAKGKEMHFLFHQPLAKLATQCSLLRVRSARPSGTELNR